MLSHVNFLAPPFSLGSHVEHFVGQGGACQPGTTGQATGAGAISVIYQVGMIVHAQLAKAERRGRRRGQSLLGGSEQHCEKHCGAVATTLRNDVVALAASK